MIHNNKYFKFLFGFIVFAFSFLEGSDIVERRFGIGITSNVMLLILLSILIVGLVYTYNEENKDKISKEINSDEKKNSGKYSIYLNIGLIFLIVILFIFYYNKENKQQDFIENKLPYIHKAFEEGDVKSVFYEAKKILDLSPNNTIVESYYNKITTVVSIFSTPSNADVYFRFYSDTSDNWIFLGETPLNDIRIPQKLVSLKFSNNNQEFITKTHPYYLNDNDNVFILPKNDFQEDKDFKLFLGRNVKLNFPGIDHIPNVKIDPYQISRTEVTNLQFQEFVSDGGYSNHELWDFPIIIDGNEFTFENSISKFVGEYGRPGPANWGYSRFLKGQEGFPVTGISWFEARAYAKYMSLDLPNIYQWSNSANMSWSSSFVPKSNFSKNQLNLVGNEETNNFNGIYDIAGNVREWCVNISNESETNRAILGGCFLDDDYFFNDYYGQNAFERSIGNGMRLVKNINANIDTAANAPTFIQTRDFYKTNQVSDDVFEVFKNQFEDYNNDLNDKVYDIRDDGSYIVQRYEIPSVNGESILPGYIFYNSSINPPYKPIIYFPGSNAIHLTNTDIMISNSLEKFDYLLEEGYAIIHPIYLSTYERADVLNSDYPEKTKQYKDHVITWGKEFKKTIDYIDIRQDLNIDKLSFYGVSWGGFMANTLLAIDSRVKAAVLNVAGYCFQETFQEIEACYYTPRIKCPVIMLNGKYDVFFPLETSQKPMFDLLGTPNEDKKHYIFPSGHYVPRKNLLSEHLAWLEKYINKKESN